MPISVVIPVHNEEANIAPLARELDEARAALGDELEAVFVNDGSRDRTHEELDRAARDFPFVRAIHLESRSGQTAALLIGLRSARHDTLVIMDGDLQNNPADIPSLVQQLDSCDVVCGRRAKRRDSWSRRAASRIGNRIRNWVTHDGISDTGCTLKAFRRECLDDIPSLNGAHRFLPAYFELNGRRVIEFDVDHRQRIHGETKYTNLKRLPTTTLDLFGFWWYRKRFLKQVRSPAARDSGG